MNSIERRFAVPVVLSVFLAALVTAYVSVSIGTWEFRFAAWTQRPGICVPVLTHWCGAVYQYVWIFPAVALVMGGLLLRGKRCSVLWLLWYLASLCISLFAWLLLLFEALYLVNQSHILLPH